MNMLKTTALLGLLTGMLMLIGELMGGTQGAVLMLGFAGIMNLGTWFFSDRIVLATSGAQPITDPRYGWVEDEVKELAQKANMPAPRVFWIPKEQSPNAFATGRSPSHGVVAVTAGLLNQLDRRQVRGVLAHELGHIKNRDTLVSAIAGTLAGAISLGARMVLFSGNRRQGGGAMGLLLYLLAPMAALVVRMMVSRTREYGADAAAAQLTGDPEGLAQALERLAGGARRRPMQTGSEATHYIVNGFSGGLSGLFSTHPPITERVRRLRTM